MKKFNKISSAPTKASRPVSYAESTGVLRQKMDSAIEIITEAPFSFAAIKSYGTNAVLAIEAACHAADTLKGSADAKAESTVRRQILEALADMNVYLGAAEKVLELYDTRYIPMTRDGCIDIGAIRKEDFENRLTALKKSCEEGEKRLAILDTPKKTGPRKRPSPPKPPKH